MSDPDVLAEPSFAAYIREENAKERAVEAGEPVDLTPQPAASTASTNAEAGGVKSPEPTAETSAEPVEAAQPDAERNPDGTFKPKAAKVNANTKEWARNRELTAKLHAQEAEIQRLRTPVAPTPNSAPPAPGILDPADPEPTIDAYLDKPDPYAALAVAAGKWAVREERRAVQAEQAQIREREQAQEVGERIATFAAAHPDYQQKMEAIADVVFPAATLQAIREDDLCPEVAYHLAQHPDEARRIAALTPLQGVKAIGQLSVRLTPATVGSGAPPVSTSRAKPLIKPVSGSPVAPESRPPDELPFGSRYIREMNAQERRAREAQHGG